MPCSPVRRVLLSECTLLFEHPFTLCVATVGWAIGHWVGPLTLSHPHGVMVSHELMGIYMGVLILGVIL